MAPSSAKSRSTILLRGAMRVDRRSWLAIVTSLARSPGLWLTVALLAAMFLMPKAAPLMRWLFPGDPRPVYTRASFFELTLAHVELVAISSLAAAVIGIGLAHIRHARKRPRIFRDGGRNRRHRPDFSSRRGARADHSGFGLWRRPRPRGAVSLCDFSSHRGDRDGSSGGALFGP